MAEDEGTSATSGGARRLRVRRWQVLSVVVLVALGGLGIWYHLSTRLPCDPGLKRFRAALERQDFDDLYAMATDIEKSQLGLTKAAVERAFRATVFKTTSQIRTRFAKIDTPAQATDRWAWRTLAIVDARTGRPLPTVHPTGEYLCLVRLYKEGDDWRIVMADVVRSMLALNSYPRAPGGASSPEGKRRRRAVTKTMLEWGFRGTLDEPEKMQIAGRWLSTAEPPVRLYDPVKE